MSPQVVNQYCRVANYLSKRVTYNTYTQHMRVFDSQPDNGHGWAHRKARNHIILSKYNRIQGEVRTACGDVITVWDAQSFKPGYVIWKRYGPLACVVDEASDSTGGQGVC